MRNLKKILALVLALVMSLSLMATASASDFGDANDITDKYQTAVQVLEGLKVFNGYAEDNTFRPKNSITREEVAAIIYRIATGDVSGASVGIYADYNKFSDVTPDRWSAGYINFCANAEYIKGNPDGTFNPKGNVTGYAALAMILRAIGYTANGGFTGADWELQTAAVAEARHITDNITAGTLGEPASRETVAEILFQSSLVNMVNYDQRTGYYELGESLGYKIFKLEKFEGVVVANEYADLNSNRVAANGKTQVQVAGEDKVRTLNYGTKITDIGESRLVYTQNGSKVLYIADSGKNTVKQYGEGVDIATDAKFRTASGMSKGSGTEYYVNFEPDGYYTSDFRIEYIIRKAMTAQQAADYASDYGFNSYEVAWPEDSTVNVYSFDKVIKAGDPITQTDYANLREIFIGSNGLNDYGSTNDNTTGNRYIGKVFVATQTKDDISDTKSFNQFVTEYLNPFTKANNWGNSANGEWVKFIDNNADGVCDYAFKTQYSLDEVISSFTNKAGDVVMQYRSGYDDDDHTNKTNDYTVRYMQDDETVERNVAVDDVVFWAIIDNQLLVSKPTTVTTEANSYNYKTDSISAADGKDYTQSGVSYRYNITGMQYYLVTMAPKTTYEMFLDKFGYVRGYRQPGETKYALVTELYYGNDANGNLIQTWPMTAELTMPDENGKAVTNEYTVPGSNDFVASAPWTYINNRSMVAELKNWLQPAIPHLGVNWTGYGADKKAPTFSNTIPNTTFWARYQQVVLGINAVNGGTFNYGQQYYTGTSGTFAGNDVLVPATTSFTNVAVVKVDGASATISGAAKLALNDQALWNTPYGANGYAVDYIQLDRNQDVSKSAASYTIGGDASYKSANNYVVHADKDTEIYVVSNEGVQYFKGYANMPALTNEKNNIHAAYAVARNTNVGVAIETNPNSSTPYWMADVIVYEVKTYTDVENTSISLAYYTAYQQLQGANGVTISTLNNKTTPAAVDLTPAGLAWGSNSNWWSDWGSSWKYYGFYRLSNPSEAVNGAMTASGITKIDSKYGDSGIFVGTVTREVDTAVLGGYIPVNMTGDTNADGTLKTEAQISIASGMVYSVTYGSNTNYAWNQNYRLYTEATPLQYNSTQWSQVKANDQVIWVGGGDKADTVNSASYIVDLGSPVTTSSNVMLRNPDIYDVTPDWLKTLYADIWSDQNPGAPTDKVKITINQVDEDGNSLGTLTKWATVGEGYNIEAEDLKITGRTITTTPTLVTTDADGNPVASTTLEDAVEKYGVYRIDKQYVTANATTNVLNPITVTVTYALTTYSVQVVGTADYTAKGSLTAVQTSGAAVGSGEFTVDTTGYTTTVDLQPNSTFTLTVSNLAAGKTYTAAVDSSLNGKIDSIKQNTDGTVTVTGKVYGALVVTVTELNKDYTANITVEDRTQFTDSFESSVKFQWTTSPVITLALDAPYSLVDADIEVKDVEGNALTFSCGVNAITITDSAPAGNVITVDISNVQRATKTVTVTGDATGVTYKLNGLEGNLGQAAAGTITVKYGDVLYLVSSETAGLAYTVDSGNLADDTYPVKVDVPTNILFTAWDFGPITDNLTISVTAPATESQPAPEEPEDEGGDEELDGDEAGDENGGDEDAE